MSITKAVRSCSVFYKLFFKIGFDTLKFKIEGNSNK